MKNKKSYSQVERARMLYATYKNRLKGQENYFVITYKDMGFLKFAEMVAPYYGKNCIYCSEILTTETISLDHIVPLKRGGSTSSLNLTCICKKCNRRKGELTHLEYAALLSYLENKPEMKAIVLKRLSAAGFMFFKR